MKTSVTCIVLSILFWVDIKGLNAQQSSNKRVTDFIFFEFSLTHISPQIEDELDKHAKQLLEKKDLIKENYYINLLAYYCLAEHELDQFIGVKRALLVQKYLIEKTGFTTRTFVISDPGPYENALKTNKSCDYSAIQLLLIKK